MNEIVLKDVYIRYQEAEKRAKEYFQKLERQVDEHKYLKELLNDFSEWKQNHTINSPSISSYFKWKKEKSMTNEQYIQWLLKKGKLDEYLDRSVSYIFLRDLGKCIYSPETSKRIQEVKEKLKEKLLSPSQYSKTKIITNFNKEDLYLKGKQEGIEQTMIWLFEKLASVRKNLPTEMDAVHSERKLLKIIVGVFLHMNEEMIRNTSTKEERMKKLDEAIRLGYCYGLTYPFIDDLLDSHILSSEEQQQYSEIIRQALLTGNVSNWGKWQEQNKNLMNFVHKELKEAFEYIKSFQNPNVRVDFFEQAYVFFNAQEIDRNKSLENSEYTNEEIYVPVILKSASSRFITRALMNPSMDSSFQTNTFIYGIYNQLADDLADLFDDLDKGAVTPYTYYWKYHKVRTDLVNPFELYWSVIYYLIHHVYEGNRKTQDIILSRVINALKRLRAKLGKDQYHQVMNLFTKNIQSFNRMIQSIMRKAEHVDFYDKLLRDQLMNTLQKEREERIAFKNTIKVIQRELNEILPIEEAEDIGFKDSIIEAANYSLESGGKRLRPILTYFIGVKVYGLKEIDLKPLLKSLEYMHTASLIFDDLPSQDNASYRRGKPTLHKIYNEALAELTGLFLNQKAYEEQTTLPFKSDIVLRLIHYSAQTTGKMCRGQWLDLSSKGKRLNIKELTLMSKLKTGIGFEASLVMPAILAEACDREVKLLKEFAYHAGIAFQIKDDLLDVVGNSQILGKEVGKDKENNSATFVSILGIDGAKKEMWDHYYFAKNVLNKIHRPVQYLHYFMDYIVEREG